MKPNLKSQIVKSEIEAAAAAAKDASAASSFLNRDKPFAAMWRVVSKMMRREGHSAFQIRSCRFVLYAGAQSMNSLAHQAAKRGDKEKLHALMEEVNAGFLGVYMRTFQKTAKVQ